MRITARWLVFVFMAVAARGAEPPVVRPEGPLLPARQYKMRFHVSVSGTVADTVVNVKLEEIGKDADGVKTRMSVWGESAVPMTEEMRVSSKGIERLSLNSLPISPPLQLVSFPIKDGERKSRHTLAGQTADIVTTQTEGAVTGPDGRKYACVIVDVDANDAGKHVRAKYHLVRGVGIARIEVNFARSHVIATALDWAPR